MLGHRGCRLCITYPEILDMQVTAIIQAAIACAKKKIKVLPEIMIPLTIDRKELAILTDRTRKVADALIKEAKVKISYGTMIEVPRTRCGPRRRQTAEFSFGTNDLTQMTFGLRDDEQLPARLPEQEILEPRSIPDTGRQRCWARS
jgi:pyruvate,orthophosphate dikinase